MVSSIKDVLIQIADLLLSFLPDSPFTAYIDAIERIPELGVVNYLLPVSEMIAIGEAWLVCVGVFYLYSAVLRFVKLIE